MAGVGIVDGEDLIDADPVGAGDGTDARWTISGRSGIKSASSPGPQASSGGSQASGGPTQMQQQMQQANEDEYRMDYPRRGTAVIINNKNFESHTGMNERRGTDVDASNLYQKLQELGFDVTLHHDKKKSDMYQIMQRAAMEDHTDADCFLCVLLTHGDNGIVYGTDGVIETEPFFNLFKGDRCRTLLGKPKIFLIQACRGHELMEGLVQQDAKADKPDPGKRIPSEADILVAYSTVPGFYSWRNSAAGSWFVQALCRMLDQHGTQLDLLRLLTRVAKHVALEFESNASGVMGGKKQVPQIVSTLTRDLYFKPKTGS